MKISVVTPTFNSEKTILSNVQSVLNQTYKNFEHIIVDNQSDDKTLQLIEREYIVNRTLSKLKIICEKDNGIADAMNKGIETSSGQIIVILNSDDSFYSDNIFEQVCEAFKKKDVLMVHGDIYFDDPVFGSNVRKPLLCAVEKAMPYNHPTIFMLRSVYDKYDKYNINYRYAMDFEFICRLERSAENLSAKSCYIKEIPMVKMMAGGVSWKNELETIEETKKALVENDLWRFAAWQYYQIRKIRTKLKIILHKLGLGKTIKLWRDRKWSS